MVWSEHFRTKRGGYPVHFAEALGVKGFDSTEVWLGKYCRFHAVHNHGDEHCVTHA